MSFTRGNQGGFKKRFLSLLLTVIVVLTAFSACNSADDVPASTTACNDSATTAATTPETPSDPAPVAFNDEKLYVGQLKKYNRT